MHKKWSANPIAACAGALLALTACNGSGKPDAASTSTVTSTATVTASTTVTVTATMSAAGADFGLFLRSWEGHTRGLEVSPSGVMTEQISDGCCDLALVLVLQLSNPAGTADEATADAEVVSVYSHDVDSPPRDGQTGTVTIDNGILTDHIDGVTFCDINTPAAVGQCGA